MKNAVPRKHLSTYIKAISLGVTALLLNGCAYLHNRANDASDCIELGITMSSKPGAGSAALAGMAMNNVQKTRTAISRGDQEFTRFPPVVIRYARRSVRVRPHVCRARPICLPNVSFRRREGELVTAS